MSSISIPFYVKNWKQFPFEIEFDVAQRKMLSILLLLLCT